MIRRAQRLQRLELDFRRVPAASAWAGWVLFALAAVFATDVAVSYRDARAAVTQVESRLAALARPGDAGRASWRPRPITAEELTAARETVQRLALPWDELFGALEATATEGVVLAAIEPDAKAGTVLISGDAKDYPAVLAYVAKLRDAKSLTGAHLVRHERRADAQRPFAFAVSASWSEVPR